MLSFGGTRPDTEEDQRLYLDARLVEVACLDCLTTVRVKKNSEHHTSIQWGPDGTSTCAEFQRMNTAPGGRHVHAPCARLQASIERAVIEGTVQIGAVDGY